jgi:hypothetical protein
MLWHLYLSKGKAYVPTVARTTAGFYMDVEPVEVIQLADVDAVEAAIRRMIASGNPEISTPSRATFPKPVVLQYAKSSSWAGFERSATCWQIARTPSGYEVGPLRPSASGGWEEDPEQVEPLPHDVGATALAKAVAARICASTPRPID